MSTRPITTKWMLIKLYTVESLIVPDLEKEGMYMYVVHYGSMHGAIFSHCYMLLCNQYVCNNNYYYYDICYPTTHLVNEKESL